MFFKPHPKIGIMALQGGFAEHAEMLERMGYETVLIRSLKDTEGVSACILPGGESTTLMQLLKKTELDEWLLEKTKMGMPVFGTCAGMIVLAKLGLIDVQVDRNAYGRQLSSFEADIDFMGRNFPGIFIRAPKVINVGATVEVLSKENQTPVLLREKNILVGSFHPELTSDSKIHEYFVNFS